MKKIGFTIVISMHLLFFQQGKAQDLETAKREIIEQRIDFLLDINEDGEGDFTTLFEQLENFYERPLNLNASSMADFSELGLLNSIQINNLLFHIEKHGKLIAFEELQSIEGFDMETIRMIQPFTMVKGNYDKIKWSLNEILSEGSSDFFIRYSRILEEQRGFSAIDPDELAENPNRRYLGSVDRIFSRYRFRYANNLSIGFTGEKDPGEEFFKGTQKQGFDFYSGHVFIQNLGPIKQLALGDFQAQFGQGLTFWSGLAFGRTPSIFSLKRNAPKLRPYTSVQEDLFLRGGGATFESGNFNLTVFYSSQKVDANIAAVDTLENIQFVSSLPESGFHRTPNELAKKNAVNVSYLGGNIAYQKRNFSIGFTAVNNQIAAEFQPRVDIANQFNRLSNDNSNIGLDFSYLVKNINLFGEVSKSIDGGYAQTVGALIVLDQRLSIGLQQRNFQRDFKPIQSNAIGESTSNSNERGTFIGFESNLSKAWSVSAYADRFVFPWLRFRSDAPSEGDRLFAQLNYKPNKQLLAYFRYRKRDRGRNLAENGEVMNTVVEESNENFRLHFDYQISKNIKIASRVEYINYKLGSNRSESGFLIFQELRYKKLSSPLSFSTRFALFDTESFDSRIYAYESDVLYAFSIPAFNGRGSRFYIVTKYHLSRSVDIWLRYAQTYFTDRTFVGSGNDLIEGNTRSEIKAQLRVKF